MVVPLDRGVDLSFALRKVAQARAAQAQGNEAFAVAGLHPPRRSRRRPPAPAPRRSRQRDPSRSRSDAAAPRSPRLLSRGVLHEDLRRACPDGRGFVCCSLWPSPPARTRAGDDGAELKARTHFAAGEYKEALDIYARLYAETMHPTYLRNIARCHQNLGNPDKAISSFREYLRKARDLSPDQRAEIEGYIAEMEQLKQSKTAGRRPAPRRPPPAAPPPAESSPALVGPPTVTASGARDDDGGGFYTRVWFWGDRRGRRGGRHRHRAAAHARQRPDGGQSRRAGPEGQRTVTTARSIRRSLDRARAIGSCAKDKTTALDIKLELVGDIDQVRVDGVTVGGNPRAAHRRADPVSDVATDAEDRRRADHLVRRQPRRTDRRRDGDRPAVRQGRDRPSDVGVEEPGEGTTVQTTLALANDGTVCTGDGGSAGAGGTGGTSGTGGTAGGSAGTAGAAGASGSGRIGAGRQRGAPAAPARRDAAEPAAALARRAPRVRPARRDAAESAAAPARRDAVAPAAAARRGRTRWHRRYSGRRRRAWRHRRCRAPREGVAPAAARHRNWRCGRGLRDVPFRHSRSPSPHSARPPAAATPGTVQTVDNIWTFNDYFAYASGVAFGNSANCGRAWSWYATAHHRHPARDGHAGRQLHGSGLHREPQPGTLPGELDRVCRSGAGEPAIASSLPGRR